jgi:hypothetical protein
MEKLKLGDKVKIRKVKSAVYSDEMDGVKYYFISEGRRLLRDLGMTKDDSPKILGSGGQELCIEDELKLANRFSDVPAVIVGKNPIRATSLEKLQEFIDHVISVSDTIKETKSEKEDRKWKKREAKAMRFEPFGIEFGDPFGRPGPQSIQIAEFFDKMKKENKKLKKRISVLEEKINPRGGSGDKHVSRKEL